MGVSPGDRVALWLPNSVEFVTSALGVLVDRAALSFVGGRPPRPAGPHRRRLRSEGDRVSKPGRGALRLVTRHQADTDAISASPVQPPSGHRIPIGTPHLTYTSGTTGMPKGVRIPETAFGWAISTMARWRASTTTRPLCVSPFHFDGSYGTLFPTLFVEEW